MELVPNEWTRILFDLQHFSDIFQFIQKKVFVPALSTSSYTQTAQERKTEKREVKLNEKK